MRRILTVLITMMVSLACLYGCGTNKTAGSDPGLRIVVTIFPEYDWVMNVLGENPSGADVTLLLDKGTDLHSFQPGAEEIMKIAECDLFIYVGGESDEWAEDALKESRNPDLTVLNLMDILGENAKEEEEAEGMEAEAEEADEEETEYDEHVWLSLKNAETFVQEIADAISAKDPENGAVYQANAKEYTAKLAALDEEYSQMVKDAKYSTLVFGDRFPFRYLTDDYDLSYYAAFKGCSAETEASFETILFLAKKLDELKLPCIMTIDSSNQKIAKTVIENSASKDQTILTLNSMQGVTAEGVKQGETYLGIMEDNLAVLKEALN